MGIFTKMKEPVFLRESNNAEMQLKALKLLEPELNQEGRELLTQDIKKLEYGIAGEKKIKYELRSSHMPIYILHDVCFYDGDLDAQIDFIVFTKKMSFLIECKNLYGNISIDNTGAFRRTIDYGTYSKTSGIYSPITQNQKHLELMKKITLESISNPLVRMMSGKHFEEYNRSVVVLANESTIINARYAPKSIKEKVIRADALIEYIKKVYRESDIPEVSEKALLQKAQSYLKLHKEIERDYISKYDKYKKADIQDENIHIENVVQNVCENRPKAFSAEQDIESTEIFKALKAYRLTKSRDENIKPYYIYNDKQLKDLILRMPCNKEELMNISGFGEAKVKKYGDEIIEIISKYK